MLLTIHSLEFWYMHEESFHAQVTDKPLTGGIFVLYNPIERLDQLLNGKARFMYSDSFCKQSHS